MKKISATVPETQSRQTETKSRRLAIGQAQYHVHARPTMGDLREMLPPLFFLIKARVLVSRGKVLRGGVGQRLPLHSVKSLSLQYSALLATQRIRRRASAGGGGGGAVGEGSTDSGA